MTYKINVNIDKTPVIYNLINYIRDKNNISTPDEIKNILLTEHGIEVLPRNSLDYPIIFSNEQNYLITLLKWS